jgi:hypothetical protein
MIGLQVYMMRFGLTRHFLFRLWDLVKKKRKKGKKKGPKLPIDKRHTNAIQQTFSSLIEKPCFSIRNILIWKSWQISCGAFRVSDLGLWSIYFNHFWIGT